MSEYEGMRRIVYGEGATFVPVCPQCGRFVKADDTIEIYPEGNAEGLVVEGANATCSKCGRVGMLFEGYI